MTGSGLDEDGEMAVSPVVEDNDNYYYVNEKWCHGAQPVERAGKR